MEYEAGEGKFNLERGRLPRILAKNPEN